MNGSEHSDGSGNLRASHALSAREATERTLDAMCIAAGWPKGYRPEYDHAPFHTNISAGEIGYYALRNGRAGSPFMS